MRNLRLKPQNAEFTMFASEELGTRKSTGSRFIKLTRRSRLQSMDTGISRKKFQKFQEEIKRQSLNDDRATRKQSLIMTKVISYLKKSSLEGGHYPPRHDHENYLEGG